MVSLKHPSAGGQPEGAQDRSEVTALYVMSIVGIHASRDVLYSDRVESSMTAWRTNWLRSTDGGPEIIR